MVRERVRSDSDDDADLPRVHLSIYVRLRVNRTCNLQCRKRDISSYLIDRQMGRWISNRKLTNRFESKKLVIFYTFFLLTRRRDTPGIGCVSPTGGRTHKILLLE